MSINFSQNASKGILALFLISVTPLGVAQQLLAPDAKTTAYLYDSINAASGINQFRGSDRYTVTIEGETGIKPVQVYKSDNDIIWNGGDICLDGDNNAIQGVCSGADTSKYNESLMTKSHHWSSFDYSAGFVRLRISSTCGGFTSQNIEGPRNRNNIIHPKIAPVWNIKLEDSNTLSLDLFQPSSKHWPRQFYLKLPGGDCHDDHPLFIFANPIVPDENPVKVGCPQNHSNNVTYLGHPGHESVIDPNNHDGDSNQYTLILGPESANKEFCIPGGAYVKGRIVIDNAENVRITGRGILSGVNFRHYRIGSWTGTQLIEAKNNSRSLNIDGITLTDAPRANIESDKNIIIRNVKMLAWHVNTDGIAGTRFTDIDDVFLKVNDDSLKMSHSNIEIDNAIVWQQIAGSVVQLSWNNTNDAANSALNNLVLIGADSNQYPPNWNFNASIIAARNLMTGTIQDYEFENITAEVTPYSFMVLQLDEKFLGMHQSAQRQRIPCQGMNYTCDELDGNGFIEKMRLKNITVPDLPLFRGPIDQLPETPNNAHPEPDTINDISLYNVFFGDKKIVVKNTNGENPLTEVNWTNVFEPLGGFSGINDLAW